MAALVTELVPIERIKIPNPRSRNQHLFQEIVDSIGKVGLKRPITVSRRAKGRNFDLICGQGRIEAFRALGQSLIPAIVLDATVSECMVKSLVENVARRRHTHMELLGDIAGLKQRGYDNQQVAIKTGLSPEYVAGITRLLENGEQRLINGVERGTIPLTVAIDIAAANRPDIQSILQSAYESGVLRGHKLIAARRLVESRQRKGKSTVLPSRGGEKMTVAGLVRTYERDAERKRHLIREVRNSDEHLAVLAHILKSLLADPGFVAVLDVEGLSSLPECLARRIKGEEGTDANR
ncbi:ParB N-terminal domain-containing protein [Emcibacter sp. SYSU 3D8]|uniref:ParB/RepB/Spo0J family partition protein n=1 Tax=Emcibacter sp. SYSU 3D8 TaxID=3133969 RepID=UPI0031FF3986